MKIEYVQTENEKEFMNTMKENLSLLKDPEMVIEGICIFGTILVVYFGLILLGA